MTDTVRPSKRLRRWGVGALAFVIGAMAIWWYWPRGDARFVGTWELWKPGLNAPAGFMEFRPNGMMSESGRPGQRGQGFPWRVDGSNLSMGYEVGHFAGLNDTFSAFVHRWTGWWPVIASAGPWEFRLIDADTIEIRLDAGNIFTLRRVRP